MTGRQAFLKLLYPLLLLKGKLFVAKQDVLHNSKLTKPANSFFDLQAIANNGAIINFDSFKNSKVLIVNTASNCGFTAQYDALEKLYQQYKTKLVIIAFPSNDFKNQETDDDATIESFCRVNYGVSFPLMKKSVVVKSDAQTDVYKWLTHASKNGWNDQPPVWNFSKYLINEEGVLTHYFAPVISPLAKQVIDAIED